MRVASDTSPISNLAIIGHLDLLRTQFREICIPSAVKAELDLLGYPSALKDIQQALNEGWIKLRPLREDKIVRLLEATLDPGDAEAIALALELQADVEGAGLR
jgi:predicted nucleic acid-binding protein